MSREDLAAYLSSMSDMVSTGHRRRSKSATAADRVTTAPVPEIRVNNQPLQSPHGTTSQHGKLKMLLLILHFLLYLNDVLIGLVYQLLPNLSTF